MHNSCRKNITRRLEHNSAIARTEWIDQEDEGLFDIFEEFENMIMHLMLKLMDVSTIFFLFQVKWMFLARNIV